MLTKKRRHRIHRTRRTEVKERGSRQNSEKDGQKEEPRRSLLQIRVHLLLDHVIDLYPHEFNTPEPLWIEIFLPPLAGLLLPKLFV